MITKILKRFIKSKPEFKMKPYTQPAPPIREVSDLTDGDEFLKNIESLEAQMAEPDDDSDGFSYTLTAKVFNDTVVLKLGCSGFPDSYDFPVSKSDFDTIYKSDYLFFLANRIVKSLTSIYPFVNESILLDSIFRLPEDEFLNVSYQLSYRLNLYFQYFSSNFFGQKINEIGEDKWTNIKSQVRHLNSC